MSWMSCHREELAIETGDGVAPAFIHRRHRTAEGAHPAVLLYHDAFGVRPAMHAIADRLAALGYVVLLPGLFYRAGEYAPFDKATVFGDPPERERLMALVRALTPERLRADASAYLAALRARPDVRQDRIAAVGYCMGGRLAFLTAALCPGDLRAAASFHGGGLVTDAPDSPHRLAGQVRASLYLGVADGDRTCTPEHQGALATALGAAGVAYTIELYPGKRHGFAVSDHPGAHDADAAERHWRRLESFLGETLRDGAAAGAARGG